MKLKIFLAAAIPFVIAMTCIIVPALAQDSTAIALPISSDLLDKIGAWTAAIIAVYEVIVRLVPTVKDLSFVNKIIAIVQWIVNIIPNLKAGGGKH